MAFNKISKDPMRFVGHFLRWFDKNKSAHRVQFKEDYDFSIANTRFVGSHSLMANCDIKPTNPKSSFIDHKYLAEIPDMLSLFEEKFAPPSLYICTDALPKFANEILKRIQKPFVLVTGDSDIPVDRSYLGNALEQIIGNKYLVNWYAQNRAIDNQKIHSLPIGLDFHSKWSDPQIWGGGFILPALQELQLKNIFAASPSWSERQPKAYCDWIFSLERGDRLLCRDQIDITSCVFPPQILSRLMTWKAQSSYAFVVSPSGVGIDCHRTWEALMLGCVPIVKRQKMSDLFEGLPVIIVEDWSQITQSFLNQQHALLRSKNFDYSKLFLTYWYGKISNSGTKYKKLYQMNMAEFHQYVCF